MNKIETTYDQTAIAETARLAKTQSKTDLLQQELLSLKQNMSSQDLLKNKVDSLALDLQGKMQALQDTFQQTVHDFYKSISRQKEKEIDEIKSETLKAEEQLSTIKQEVDALQIEVMQPKIWYKDAPTVISLIAVMFSLSTATASYWQVENQSRVAARSELRSLIQRLTVMPVEQAELYAAYGEDAMTYGNLASNWNTEYILLADQAVELADRIPKDISAPEYVAITQALANQGITEPVSKLVEAGLDVSKDINSETALLRIQANHKFIMGNVDQGREIYQEAIDAVEKYSVNSYFGLSFNAYTKMLWANSEYNSGHCDEARKIAAEADLAIAELLPSPAKDGLKSQLNSAQNYRDENTQLCQA